MSNSYVSRDLWRHERSRLASTTALGLVALLTAVPVAQAAENAQSAQAPAVEEIVVTGSRIVRDGYEAPTPLTVIDSSVIQQTATANLADTLKTMPVFQAGFSPTRGVGTPSSYGGGVNILNLRGLGFNRNLILIDGQRTVAARLDGAVDINGIPQQLVSRVDIVTGGASAVYGSDAVSGVVNFILDKNFTGVKGEISGGVTTYGDDRNYKISLTAGTAFAGGRGHLTLSGEINNKDAVNANYRPWNLNGWGVIGNPSYTATNGQPNRLVLPDVESWYTKGGIIDSGPLKGIAFGVGGAPYQFNFGSLTSGIYTAGGGWRDNQTRMDTVALDPLAIRKNIFARVSYELTDNFNVFGQFSWNDSFDDNHGFQHYQPGNGPTILSGNPFIPAAVQAQMTALGLTSIHIGSMNYDLPIIGSRSDRRTHRYVVGGDGNFDAFDSNWKWNVYFQEGITHVNYNSTGVTRRSLRAQAMDAVRDPKTGLIVCRSTLTNPNDGCVPYNPMGIGVNGAATLNYLTSGTIAHTDLRIVQDVVAGSVTGEPFSNWAGPVSLALNVEHRLEKATGVPERITLLSDWQAGNFLPFSGRYTVNEGAAETVVPLAKDMKLIEAWDLNAGFRVTDYSTSGKVTTWKVGTTYQPISDIRVRATRSRDIRAPNLQDLFNNVISGFFTVQDVFTNSTPTFLLQQNGNAALRPEKADTTDIGVVLQPRFFPGLSVSFDYWNIDMSDAIATPSLNQIVLFCFQGSAQYCGNITRTNGVITGMVQSPFNIAVQTTRGLDLEGSYRFNLEDVIPSWSGQIGLHANSTIYLKNYSDTKLAPPTDNVGENGTDAGLPDWSLTARVDYTNGPFSTSFTGRAISSGTLRNTYIECTTGCPASGAQLITINNNYAPGYFYMDWSVSYNFEVNQTNMEAFLNIRNLANKDPGLIPHSADDFGYIVPQTNTSKYDFLGRVFRAGIRFKM